jgi:hypothetical protein
MFTKGTIPKVISRRYDEKGNVIEGCPWWRRGKKSKKEEKSSKKASASEKKRELVKA